VSSSGLALMPASVIDPVFPPFTFSYPSPALLLVGRRSCVSSRMHPHMTSLFQRCQGTPPER
jgi:hypothetical protein